MGGWSEVWKEYGEESWFPRAIEMFEGWVGGGGCGGFEVDEVAVLSGGETFGGRYWRLFSRIKGFVD
jgi:hypothetical protein